MPNKPQKREIHVFIDEEEYKDWVLCKESIYNGARAMALMIRTFVSERVKEELSRRQRP